MPSDKARKAGAERGVKIESQAVDLLDNAAFIEPEIGEIAVCSQCAAALVFAGWMEIDTAMLALLSPAARKMIRDGQEAARRFRANFKANFRGIDQ